MVLLTQASSLLAVLLTGLLAGLFYGYYCSVNPGLHPLHDRAYLQAMQSINKVILNPVFFTSFLGALVMSGIAAVATYKIHQFPNFYFFLAAFIVYLTGVFGVTALGNVPLNEALATFDLNNATDEVLQKQRQLFEQPWNKFHTIRTVSAVGSFLLTIIALLR